MNIKEFQQNLLQWYEVSHRILPWRKNKEPYRVLVSEIMLQQTRVDTVIPYFERFMDWFPTVDDFANAGEEKILKSWEGLGYYSRVRNLHSAVKEIAETYNGIVPNTKEEISKLKGIGPYTAGAVLSIAYDKPEPAVDGNVMRVYSRIFKIEEDIAKPASRKIFEQKVHETISHDNPSSFNQGLMELGAMICTPISPKCTVCPVNKHCVAFNEGIQDRLPNKTKMKKGKTVQYMAVIVENDKGKLLIQKRPSKGLLAGLWEFPIYELTNSKDQFQLQLKLDFEDQYSMELANIKPIGQVKHIFSHLVWDVQVFSAQILQMKNKGIWVSEVELTNYTLPIPMQKMLELFVYQK
ncbi:MAG: mutY [Bacillales bacterium]|jgi:A/G-specific adenine glycosylase|nr:mutY [Bacillales bacterium]